MMYTAIPGIITMDTEKAVANPMNLERRNEIRDTGLDRTHAADPERFSSSMTSCDMIIVAIPGEIVAIR